MYSPNVLLTSKQAAIYLGVAVASLAKWRVMGCGPTFIKCGCAVRYHEGDLEAWLKSRRFQSTSQVMSSDVGSH